METTQNNGLYGQVVVMTPPQIEAIVDMAVKKAMAAYSEQASSAQPAPRYVYGIGGIASLFGVTKQTAQAYKNTWLAPAVMQRGKHIMTDANKAMELFNAR